MVDWDKDRTVLVKKARRLRRSGYSHGLIGERLGVSKGWSLKWAGDIVPTKTVARWTLDQARRDAEVSPLSPSEDFAYFLGFFSGDGTLVRGPKTHLLELFCDDAYPGIIDSWESCLERLLPDLNISRRQRPGCTGVYVYGVRLPMILGIPPGDKRKSGFTVPVWVFDPLYASFFLKGLIESDGCVVCRKRFKGEYWECSFRNVNPSILGSFEHAAQVLDFSPRRHKSGEVIGLTKTVEVKRLVSELGLEEKIRYLRR